MSRNVMLYLDDIQQTSPEPLLRFTPLADATRRIEGVVDGEPTTLDLRPKSQLTGRASDDENERWNEIVARSAARFAAADGVGRVVDAIDRVADRLPDDD